MKVKSVVTTVVLLVLSVLITGGLVEGSILEADRVIATNYILLRVSTSLLDRFGSHIISRE